jgi:hypothetical protein
MMRFPEGWIHGVATPAGEPVSDRRDPNATDEVFQGRCEKVQDCLTAMVVSKENSCPHGTGK